MAVLNSSGGAWSGKATLNIAPKTSWATAKINMATFAYPLAEIICDTTAGSWSTVKQGMLVEFSRSGVVYYRGTIRKDYSASFTTTLYIGACRKGDGGFASDVNYIFADNDDVTIYDVYPPDSFWSRIDETSGVLYKQWDLDNGTGVDAYNRFPIPLVNIGAWHRVEKGVSGYGQVRHTIDSTTTAYWHNVNRITGASDGWRLPTGATFEAPDVYTDTTVDINYLPGCNVITYRLGLNYASATPDAGTDRVGTGRRYVWCIDNASVTSSHHDFSDLFSVEILSDETAYNMGRVMKFRASGTGLSARIYAGAPVLFEYQMKYNDGFGATSTNSPWHKQKFCGYISTFDTVRDDGDEQSIEFTVENPLSIMQRLGIANQIIKVGNGNRWFRVLDVFMDVGFFVYWLIAYHAPNISMSHDIDLTDTRDFEHIAFTCETGDMYSAVQAAAAYIAGGYVGCKWDGTLIVRRDYRYESDTYLAGVTSYTFNEDDVMDAVQYTRDEWRKVYEVRGGYFFSGTTKPPTAKLAHSSKYAPARGTQSDKMPDFISLGETGPPSTTANQDGKDRVGRRFALLNAAVSSLDFTLASLHPIAQYDPAQELVYDLDIEDYDPLSQYSITNGDWIHQTTSIRWSHDAGSALVPEAVLSFAPLTRGQRASIEVLPAVASFDPPVGGAVSLTVNTFAPTVTGKGTTSGANFISQNYTETIPSPYTVYYISGLSMHKALNKWVTQVNVTFSVASYTGNNFVYNVQVGTYDNSGEDVYSLLDGVSLWSDTDVTTASHTLTFNSAGAYIENLWIFISSSAEFTATYAGTVTVTAVTYVEA